MNKLTDRCAAAILRSAAVTMLFGGMATLRALRRLKTELDGATAAPTANQHPR